MATWKKPLLKYQAPLHDHLRQRPRSFGQTISSHSRQGIPRQRAESHIHYTRAIFSTMLELDQTGKTHKIMHRLFYLILFFTR